MRNDIAVIFDMDGVLIDSEPIHIQIEKQLYNELGIVFDEIQHQRFLGRSNSEMWKQLLEENNLNNDLQTVMDRNLQLFLDRLHKDGEIRAMEFVEASIQSIIDNGFKIAVASSSSPMLIGEVLKKIKLDTYFETRVSGEEVAHSKPAPDIFLKTAGLLGVEPQKCVVIEDSPNGLKAAREAGMTNVYYNPAQNGNSQVQYDTTISSFKELTSKFIINLLNK